MTEKTVLVLESEKYIQLYDHRGEPLKVRRTIGFRPPVQPPPLKTVLIDEPRKGSIEEAEQFISAMTWLMTQR